MSVAQLAAPNQNTKPGSIIYQETIVCKNLTVSGTQTLNDTEIKNNLLVDGYLNFNSDQISTGQLYMSTAVGSVATPLINGGLMSTFNQALTKVIQSQGSGANTAGSTVDGGATWTQLTTPFANPAIEWNPDLGQYSGIDAGGTATYTSPTAVNGTWVLGTPYPGPGVFASNSINYFPAFGRWYTGTSDPNNYIASSLTGAVYGPQAANRNVQAMTYAPASSGLGAGLGRLVAVGDIGPQYSDDGKSWTNSNSTASMSGVCYSAYWKKFVASPRGAPINSIYQSVDGITWTVSTPGFEVGNPLRSIAWSDQLQVFQIVGDNSRFWVSKNGLLWRRQSYAFAVSFYGCKFYPQWGNFIATGNANLTAFSPRMYVP